MKDRIKQIMEKERMTPSAFADKLQLGRAVISHILNGRNNPSLDVVTRILSKITYINPEWLLTGVGDMYKPTNNNTITNNTPNNLPLDANSNLFDQVTESISNDEIKSEYGKENEVEQPNNSINPPINQTIVYQKASERKINKIIIYYSDNTFETFNTDNRPL